MTTLREAAQQALEALKTGGWNMTTRAIADLERALAQQAEPVEPVEPVAWDVTKDGRLIYDYDFTHDVSLRVMGDFENDEQRSRYAQRIVDKLNAAPAQRAEPVEPVEPVDVGLLEYRGNSVAFIHQKMTAYRTGIDAAWDAFRANGLHPDGKTSLADMIAKHTAPPPPQRKPLTEEEIMHIGMTHQSLRQVVRAVERAHGIKEN